MTINALGFAHGLKLGIGTYEEHGDADNAGREEGYSV